MKGWPLIQLILLFKQSNFIILIGWLASSFCDISFMTYRKLKYLDFMSKRKKGAGKKNSTFLEVEEGINEDKR